MISNTCLRVLIVFCQRFAIVLFALLTSICKSVSILGLSSIFFIVSVIFSVHDSGLDSDEARNLSTNSLCCYASNSWEVLRFLTSSISVCIKSFISKFPLSIEFTTSISLLGISQTALLIVPKCEIVSLLVSLNYFIIFVHELGWPFSLRVYIYTM